MAFTKDDAAAAGARGGKARAARRLKLEQVAETLGPLETLEHAMHRLDVINVWIAAGLLSGSAGSASVRAIEVWLRGHESLLARHVVEELAVEVRRLKKQLAGRLPQAV